MLLRRAAATAAVSGGGTAKCPSVPTIVRAGCAPHAVWPIASRLLCTRAPVLMAAAAGRSKKTVAAPTLAVAQLDVVNTNSHMITQPAATAQKKRAARVLAQTNKDALSADAAGSAAATPPPARVASRAQKAATTATAVPLLPVTPVPRARKSRKSTSATAAFNGASAELPSSEAVTPPRTLLLVDASGLIFRHYFGMKHRHTPITAHVTESVETPDSSAPASLAATVTTQRDVGALYGYASALLHLCAALRPTHVAACMDLGRTSFRHALFPDYKGERKPVEDALRWQLSQLANVTSALGIHPISAPGFEADDVIGTLAHLAVGETDSSQANASTSSASSTSTSAGLFDRVVILSNDKDFAQCLTSRVSLLSPQNGVGAHYVFTHLSDVPQRFGVSSPARFRDFLVLLGDVVDGIPGVAGIGDTKARQLMNKYESLEEIMQAIRSGSKLPVTASAKVSASLVAAESNFSLWRQLATIRTDVGSLLLPGDSSWDQLRYRGPTANHTTDPTTSTDVDGATMTTAAAVAASASVTRVEQLYRSLNFPSTPPTFSGDTADSVDGPSQSRSTSSLVASSSTSVVSSTTSTSTTTTSYGRTIVTVVGSGRGGAARSSVSSSRETSSVRLLSQSEWSTLTASKRARAPMKGDTRKPPDEVDGSVAEAAAAPRKRTSTNADRRLTRERNNVTSE